MYAMIQTEGATGSLMPIEKGDLIKDFRGKEWEFDKVMRLGGAGGDAKVLVRDPERNYSPREFYASVFPGVKVYG